MKGKWRLCETKKRKKENRGSRKKRQEWRLKEAGTQEGIIPVIRYEEGGREEETGTENENER